MCEYCQNLRSIILTAKEQKDQKKVRVFIGLLRKHQAKEHQGKG